MYDIILISTLDLPINSEFSHIPKYGIIWFSITYLISYHFDVFQFLISKPMRSINFKSENNLYQIYFNCLSLRSLQIQSLAITLSKILTFLSVNDAFIIISYRSELPLSNQHSCNDDMFLGTKVLIYAAFPVLALSLIQNFGHSRIRDGKIVNPFIH